MKPKSIWANLSVANLQRTTQFYTELGFKPNGESAELTSFCVGDNDFVLHFFLKERFDVELNGMAAGSKPGSEVIFSLSATSKEEVDQCAEEVKQAGGTTFFGPGKCGEGYNFGFADPDGHKFNVLYWPGM
ncbi:VOC family protein [Roseimicrobium sp. ORNL1]|uniref:VOC family protein n=1 Tax=Roseimicrobium sp. ORNL1 TaxID=2711231 RepID=UPI0013E1DEE7|nr:VOC family protein [Roseimicrobium sp. ORNL1]QIF03560.1 glyoxalase [Roseimicrobium sp. ORNL1]